MDSYQHSSFAKVRDYLSALPSDGGRAPPSEDSEREESVHHSGTYLPSNNGGAKLSDERRIFAQTKISAVRNNPLRFVAPPPQHAYALAQRAHEQMRIVAQQRFLRAQVMSYASADDADDMHSDEIINQKRRSNPPAGCRTFADGFSEKPTTRPTRKDDVLNPSSYNDETKWHAWRHSLLSNASMPSSSSAAGNDDRVVGVTSSESAKAVESDKPKPAECDGPASGCRVLATEPAVSAATIAGDETSVSKEPVEGGAIDVLKSRKSRHWLNSTSHEDAVDSANTVRVEEGQANSSHGSEQFRVEIERRGDEDKEVTDRRLACNAATTDGDGLTDEKTRETKAGWTLGKCCSNPSGLLILKRNDLPKIPANNTTKAITDYENRVKKTLPNQPTSTAIFSSQNTHNNNNKVEQQQQSVNVSVELFREQCANINASCTLPHGGEKQQGDSSTSNNNNNNNNSGVFSQSSSRYGSQLRNDLPLSVGERRSRFEQNAVRMPKNGSPSSQRKGGGVSALKAVEIPLFEDPSERADSGVRKPVNDVSDDELLRHFRRRAVASVEETLQLKLRAPETTTRLGGRRPDAASEFGFSIATIEADGNDADDVAAPPTSTSPVTASYGASAIRVSAVDADLPAERAGLKVNDRLLRINGEPIAGKYIYSVRRMLNDALLFLVNNSGRQAESSELTICVQRRKQRSGEHSACASNTATMNGFVGSLSSSSKPVPQQQQQQRRSNLTCGEGRFSIAGRWSTSVASSLSSSPPPTEPPPPPPPPPGVHFVSSNAHGTLPSSLPPLSFDHSTNSSGLGSSLSPSSLSQKSSSDDQFFSGAADHFRNSYDYCKYSSSGTTPVGRRPTLRRSGGGSRPSSADYRVVSLDAKPEPGRLDDFVPEVERCGGSVATAPPMSRYGAAWRSRSALPLSTNDCSSGDPLKRFSVTGSRSSTDSSESSANARVLCASLSRYERKLDCRNSISWRGGSTPLQPPYLIRNYELNPRVNGEEPAVNGCVTADGKQQSRIRISQKKMNNNNRCDDSNAEVAAESREGCASLMGSGKAVATQIYHTLSPTRELDDDDQLAASLLSLNQTASVASPDTSARMTTINGGPNSKMEAMDLSADEEIKVNNGALASKRHRPPPPLPPLPDADQSVKHSSASLPPTPIPIVITPAPDSSGEESSDEVERRYDNSFDDDDDEDAEEESDTTITDKEEYYDLGEDDAEEEEEEEESTTNSTAVNHKIASKNRHSSFGADTAANTKLRRSSSEGAASSATPPPPWRYEPTVASSAPTHRQWRSADDAVEAPPQVTETKKSDVSAAVPLRPSSVKRANGVWHPLSHSEPSLPDHSGTATQGDSCHREACARARNDTVEVDSQAVRIDFPQDDRNFTIDDTVETLCRKPELNEFVAPRKEKMPPIPPLLPPHMDGDRPPSRMVSLTKEEKDAIRTHHYESVPEPQARLEFSTSSSSSSEEEEGSDVRQTAQSQKAPAEFFLSSDGKEQKGARQAHPKVPKPSPDDDRTPTAPVHVERWSSGCPATEEFQYVPICRSAPHPEEPLMWRQIPIQYERTPPVNRYVQRPAFSEATRRPYASDTQICRTRHQATAAEEQHRRFREIVRTSYSAMVTDEQRCTDAEECRAPAGSTHSLPAAYWPAHAVSYGEQQQHLQQQIRQQQQQQRPYKVPPKKPLRHYNPMCVLRDDDRFVVTYSPQQPPHFQKKRKDGGSGGGTCAVGQRPSRPNCWQENSDGNERWSASSSDDDEAERAISPVRYRVYARDMSQIGEIPTRKRPEKDPREWRRFVGAQREPLPGDRTSRNRINADERFALYPPRAPRAPPPAALASSDGEYEAATEAEAQQRSRLSQPSDHQRKHQHQVASSPLRPIIKPLQPPTDYRNNSGKRHVATTITNNNNNNNNSSTDDDNDFCRKGADDEAAAVEIPVERSGFPEDMEVVRVSGKNRCSHCNLVLGRGAAMIIDTLSLCYHLGCFRCHVCHAVLGDGRRGADVRLRGTRLHCLNCYSSPERDSRISNI